MLTLSIQNVKVRLHRAKEMLKNIILSSHNREDIFAYYRPKCDKLTHRVMDKIMKMNR